MLVWFSRAFVFIQLHLLHGILFPSLSYLLAIQGPGKHSRLFWEPVSFFELVGRLRRCSFFATYEYILLISSVSWVFPLFVIFQGLSAWLHYPSNGFVIFDSSALKIRPSIVDVENQQADGNPADAPAP